jgi:hypothetical protein
LTDENHWPVPTSELIWNYQSYSKLAGLFRWRINLLQGCYLHRTTKIKKSRHTTIPQVGFKPTIPVFKQVTTFRALDTAIIITSIKLENKNLGLIYFTDMKRFSYRYVMVYYFYVRLIVKKLAEVVIFVIFILGGVKFWL